MLGIGEFARRGRISVRMLRHYDAMGLLTPAHVDEWTGRRAYEVSQLARLNRLVVLVVDRGKPLKRLIVPKKGPLGG